MPCCLLLALQLLFVILLINSSRYYPVSYAVLTWSYLPLLMVTSGQGPGRPGAGEEAREGTRAPRAPGGRAAKKKGKGKRGGGGGGRPEGGAGTLAQSLGDDPAV